MQLLATTAGCNLTLRDNKKNVRERPQNCMNSKGIILKLYENPNKKL